MTSANATATASAANECPNAPPPLPAMECVDRVKKLPLVEAAWKQSAALYNTAKAYNALLGWTLSSAEATVNSAVQHSLPVVAPIVKRLESPLNAVDRTLCKGLDAMEISVPCIKQEPAQLAETAKNLYDPALQQVKSLQELSWVTANQLLKSDLGNALAGGIDSLTATADKILDYILPPGEPEDVPRGEKVIQALVTIGGLPIKAARHGYETMCNILNSAGKQDLRQNIKSILTLIQLQNLAASFMPKENSTQSSPQEPGQTSQSSQSQNDPQSSQPDVSADTSADTSASTSKSTS